MGLAVAKTQPEYEDLLAKVSDIRTLPVVAARVNELINDPGSSSSDIAEVLKKDQVLTAKVLRLVNSSYYAIPGGVTDVRRALAFLGFNTIAQLVLSLSVFSIFPSFEGEELSMPEFWKHALATAICSELLARDLGVPKPEEAFTCGLLHDVGKLVLHEMAPNRLAELVREAKGRRCGIVDIERERDFPSHAYIGEVMAARWGLPQVIRLAIRYHHHDVTGMDSILPSAKPMIQIVRLANAICVRSGIGKSGDCSDGEIPSEMLAPLGLSTADLVRVGERIGVEMTKAGALLNAYR